MSLPLQAKSPRPSANTLRGHAACFHLRLSTAMQAFAPTPRVADFEFVDMCSLVIRGLALIFIAALVTYPTGGAPPTKAPPPIIEFTTTPVSEAIRQLARQGNFNVVVSDQVRGEANFRFEKLTPREALDVIVTAKQLALVDLGGVVYVMTAAERVENLHFLDQPWLPAAIAKFKKRYYDALLAEGFTKDEAIRIVSTEQIPLRELKLKEP